MSGPVSRQSQASLCPVPPALWLPFWDAVLILPHPTLIPATCPPFASWAFKALSLPASVCVRSPLSNLLSLPFKAPVF